MQISLFTRLQTVEADLRSMKDLLAEMKVNQDELRRDRDEWRWRKRTDAALDIITANLLKLMSGLRIRLEEIRLNRSFVKRAMHGSAVPTSSPPIGAKGKDAEL